MRWTAWPPLLVRASNSLPDKPPCSLYQLREAELATFDGFVCEVSKHKAVLGHSKISSLITCNLRAHIQPYKHTCVVAWVPRSVIKAFQSS